ncbi:MAG: hypothetical protein ACRDV1_15520, partial [Actinomycetes bacterium]
MKRGVVRGVRRGSSRRVWIPGLVLVLVLSALVAGLAATGRLPVDALDDPEPTPDPGRTASPSPPAAPPVLT